MIKFSLLILISSLLLIGCFKNPTSPSCKEITLKKEEIKQVQTINGRLYFINIYTPKVTYKICDSTE